MAKNHESMPMHEQTITEIEKDIFRYETSLQQWTLQKKMAEEGLELSKILLAQSNKHLRRVQHDIDEGIIENLNGEDLDHAILGIKIAERGLRDATSLVNSTDRIIEWFQVVKFRAEQDLKTAKEKQKM